MEPIGLAVGVVGLTGLFSACIDAVNRVQAYKSFGVDSRVLAARFQAAHVLLDKWGRNVGFDKATVSENHHPALEERDVVAVVEDVLRIITAICESNQPSLSRPSLVPPLLNDGGSHPLHGERRRKLSWALGAKGKLEDQVKLFETLVQQLHNLVPLNGGDVRETTASGHSSITELQQILTRIEEVNKAEIRREVLSWIGHGSADEHYHDSIQQKLDGTCNWIFERPLYQDWQSTDFTTGAKMLWINGPAGFGKTVLCASIVQHLASQFKTPVAHYFFSSELENRDHPFLAIRSWISQVVMNHREAFEHARETWIFDSDVVSTRITAMSLFKRLIGLVPNCTFIADGLDECTNMTNTNTSVTSFLRAVSKAIVGTNTRILVVSRDEPEIRHAIMDDASEGFGEYTISTGDVQSDTSVYSRSIIDRKLPNKSEDARSTLSKTMTDRCEGQFLWLKMQEKSLRKGMNMKKLRSAVEETPPGLDAVYDRNWRRIKDSPECERIFSILRWVAFALRPLNICEITEAVLIWDSEDLPIDDFPDQVDDDYIDSEIVGLCGPLIQVRSQHTGIRVGENAERFAGQQTVHLTHFSIKQFLLLNLPIPGLISVNEGLRTEYQNTLLAKACLFYIKFERTWDSTIDHPSGLGSTLRNYAAGYWHRHLKSSILTDKEVSRIALQFLDRHNRTWNSWREWFDKQHQDNGKSEDGVNSTSPGPLYYAVKLGLNHLAGALIKEHNYDLRNDLGLSTLEVARKGECQELLESLLGAGADISIVDVFGRTPLLVAVHAGQSEITKLLIARGASVTVATNRGATALHLVGDTDTAKLLIEKGASVLAVSETGTTPLHYACARGNIEMVKLLLQQGATLMAVTPHGWTPLLVTVYFGYIDVFKLLIENGAGVTVALQDGRTPLHLSSERGYPELSKLLIDEGADIMAEMTVGHTPLHLASKNGHLKVAELLIEKGASIVIEARGKFTPLHTAAKFGSFEVARLLLENGASIEGVSGRADTPLHFTCMYGHLELCKLLIEYGASIAARTPKSDLFPIHLASRYGHIEVVELLIKNGSSIMQSNVDGVTPLHLAAQTGHIDVVKLLVKDGADITATTLIERALPLHYASVNGHIEIAKLLLDQGPMGMINLHNVPAGHTSLHLASAQGHDELVKLLLGRTEIIPTLTDNLGCTALFIAARYGLESVVEALLVDARIDPGIKDWHGSTALYAAVRNGHLAATELLLTLGGMTTEGEDGFGRNVFWWARRAGNDHILQLLKNHAEKLGSPVPEDVMTDEQILVQFDPKLAFCDACTLTIPMNHEHFCPVCKDKIFCLCAECFEVVRVECRNGTHVRALDDSISDVEMKDTEDHDYGVMEIG